MIKLLSVISLCALFFSGTFAYFLGTTEIESASFLGEKGIISKKNTEKEYRFGDSITRAEVVGIALRIKGTELPENYTCKKYFSDVTENDWRCRAVEIGADEGLVSRTNKKFRPQDKITLPEVWAILVRAGGITYPKNISRETWGVDASVPQWIVDLIGGALTGLGIFPDRTVQETIQTVAKRGEIFIFAKNVIDYKDGIEVLNDLIKENKLENILTEGFEMEGENLTFGPLSTANFGPSESQVMAPYHIYNLSIAPSKSAVELIDIIKKESGEWTNPNPSVMTINGLEVVKWSEASMCEVNVMEVIGEKNNYQFYSGTCNADEAVDFPYFEKVIKALDPETL